MSKSAFATLASIGTHLSSRDRARRLRHELLENVSSDFERLTIDLEGVLSVSDSFADELFGILAQENGVSWFRNHIKLVNYTPLVQASIVRAVEHRLQLSNATKKEPDPSELTLAAPPKVAQRIR